MYEDPTCHSETLLFVQLLNDSLKEFAYNAEMAGIQYKISNDVYSMLVSSIPVLYLSRSYVVVPVPFYIGFMANIACEEF